jgi:hypothetical protein
MLRYDIGPGPSPTTAAASPSPAAFDFLTTLGGVALGRDLTGNFALTLNGVAVLRPNGTWVALDADLDALVDVTPLVLPGVDPLVFRMPSNPDRLRRGDRLIVSDAPFAPLFVLHPFERGDAGIQALDPLTGRLSGYLPARNLFLNFVVLAVSPFDPPPPRAPEEEARPIRPAEPPAGGRRRSQRSTPAAEEPTGT